MTNGDNSEAGLIDESSDQDSIHYVDNAVLCYISNMHGKRPNDLVQKILCSFYSEKELEDAKLQLLSDAEEGVSELAKTIKAKHVSNVKKKGLDASDLLAILDHMDRGGFSLPTYVTSTIFRLPGEDPDCTDPKVLQSDIKQLRSDFQKLLKVVEGFEGKLSKLDDAGSAPGSTGPGTSSAHVPTETAPESASGSAGPSTSSAQVPTETFLGSAPGSTGPSASSAHMPPESRVKIRCPWSVQGDGFLGFYTKDSPLSNFNAAPVTVGSVQFETSEHAYQHMKATLAGDPERAERITKASSPGKAKRIGEEVIPSSELQSVWLSTLTSIMENVCVLKFQQNEIARQYLMSTGNLELVEASTDSIWGCGVSINDHKLNDRRMWRGNNLLGKILMKVRENLRSRNSWSGYPSMAPSSSFMVSDPVSSMQSNAAMLQHGTSYAGQVKAPGKWNLVQKLKHRKITKTAGSNSSAVGLKGVQRVVTKDFYVGQLDKDTTKEAFESFLDAADVVPTLCYRMASRIPGTVAFRLRCDVSYEDTVLSESTWPVDVTVREWVRQTRDDTRQPRNRQPPSLDEEDDGKDV